MRLSCAIDARTLPQLTRYETRIPGREEPECRSRRHVAQDPLPAGSHVAGGPTKSARVPSWLDTVDIEAGSFGSLLKSRRNSDSAGLIAAAEERLATLGLRRSHLQVVESKSALGAQLAPEDIAGILARPRSLRERARQFERAIVMTGHCVRCLCQTAPRPRPSRGRSDGKRPGPAMAPVRLFSAGAHAPLHRETK